MCERKVAQTFLSAFDEEEADRNVCSTVPFLGYRIHHALELLHTSLGTEPLLGKRRQIRRREQG